LARVFSLTKLANSDLRSLESDQNQAETSDPRRRFSRTLTGVSVFFLVLILILSLLRSSQILFVAALYACILFEGISLTLLILSSNRDSPTINFESSSESGRFPGTAAGTDIVSSLNIYVKYATRGSNHSRREIAYILKNIISYRKEKALSVNDDTGAIQQDIQKVVDYYTSDVSREDSRKSTPFSRSRKFSRQEREAYLASLERIINWLGKPL